MLASDGQIVFEVTADGKHAIADIKDITKAIQQETGKWDQAAGKSADNIENKFSGVLKKLAAGFSAVKIGKALLDIGSAAISAASDLQEVQNVVDVTFGENANRIESWAKAAGTQFGLTETQAKKFSSTMGAMLKSSGLAGEQIVDVSTDLAGLAADMASFYNLDFDEAFSKIRSGMSGMTMPLKELGIDMSVATLNAFALSQGFDKTYDKMTQGEQTMLRYQYLMQATADAQGDFARTADGYANGLRQLETNVEQLKTKLGEVLLPVVNDVVQGLNGMLNLLTSTGERTVLDDFRDIDLKTQEKIEAIRQTADEARLLTDELDRIGNSKAQTAGTKVQQIADTLTGIKLNQGKANAVKEFLGVLSSNINTLADVQGSSADEAAAWLTKISDAANGLNEDDAKQWGDLLKMIKEGLPGIENTDFGSAFFAALGSGFGDVEKQASVLQYAVDTLGDKTNKTADEQALWLETCKRLVKTIPGLSSIINVETGEVKGGTQAVKDYIKAWEDGKTKLAYLQMHQEKGTLLEQAFADLPRLELEAKIAAWRMKKAFESVQDIYKKYGWGLGIDKEGKIDRSNFNAATEEERKALKAFADEMESSGLAKAYREASEAYDKQKQAHEDAVKMYEEEGQAIQDLVGDTSLAADSQEDWLTKVGKTSDELREMVNAASEASKALADYYEQTRANVAASVDSTVKGFGKIQTSSDKIKELQTDLSKLKPNSDEWKKLNKQIEALNGQRISSQGMVQNLQQQAEYMDKYLDLLKKARGKGISNEVLAQLSDGSTESYDLLESLADATPKEVEKINSGYQSVIDKKAELTKELTNQQLSVDKTYQSMADKAREAIAALDLEKEAAENSGKTVAGIATGISKHVGEVSSAVDAIIAQLERLQGLGINIDLGGFGNIEIKTSSGQTEGSGRFGLDYVPHDDYIARLHEGEKVLTAQEASLYRGLANGALAGVDMETLGGVMRDNVKPGGNVYLDGKIVGSVVSDRQGRAYRALQRSGWQA